jgi:hypothetical protein
MENEKCRIKADGCWELGVGSWELGVGSWELGVGSGVHRRNSEELKNHFDT